MFTELIAMLLNGTKHMNSGITKSDEIPKGNAIKTPINKSQTQSEVIFILISCSPTIKAL